MACSDEICKFEYTPKQLALSLKNDNERNSCTDGDDIDNSKSLCDFGVESSSSSFDLLLTNLWETAVKNGLFRYNLTRNGLPCKELPGRFKYIAQLNPDRAQNRRKPQEIKSANQPFNPNEFHFNKIHSKEILLRLAPSWNSNTTNENYILINVSPLEYCHVLITPFKNHCRPQKLTKEGLRLSLELCLLSNSSDFRVGFNSLCGFASVNHEHYHAYYLSHRLFIEYAPLIKVADTNKSCPWFHLEDTKYPPGFCVVLMNVSESGMEQVINPVMKFAAYCQENDVGHNLYITRGSTKNCVGHFDCVRVFLWARESSYGAKQCDAFNPALCELAGHFPIKSEEAYANLDEEYILKELHKICDEPFQEVRERMILGQF